MGAADNRWKVTETPIELPLTRAAAKLYLRVDTSVEDAIVDDCIQAAADYCERELGLALMDQQITLKLDGFPLGRELFLPMSNLLSVTSVSYIDGNGANQTFTDYTVDTYQTPGRLVNNTSTWPQTKDVANAVTVVYRAGFKAYETGLVNPIPISIKQAILLLITHWFDHRNAVFVGSGVVSDEIAFAVTALLQQYRRMGV